MDCWVRIGIIALVRIRDDRVKDYWCTVRLLYLPACIDPQRSLLEIYISQSVVLRTPSSWIRLVEELLRPQRYHAEHTLYNSFAAPSSSSM